MAEPTDHRHRLTGIGYAEFLKNLHERLRPRTYLEIGTFMGGSLALASCPSIAIDPRFRLNADIMGKKPMCLLFQESSDRFFERRDPVALLGAPVEIAFLDGMHLFEHLLRDFANVERHCRANSVIALHDCLPPHPCMTTRDRHTANTNPDPYKGWWTGDVWKLIPILKRYRPDLSIELVDCEPTGLALITNLDPASDVLRKSHDAIAAEHAAGPDDDAKFQRYWENLEITPSSSLMTSQQLTPRYWL